MKQPLIQFEHVTIQYHIYNSRSFSLRNKILESITGGLINRDTNMDTVTAINNASFTLKSGDRVGLIGGNGAGKTTLLRAMAGVYQPTQGKVTIQGSVSTIIDIGAGMDEELSGVQNIYRLGLLRGMKRKEIDALLPSIEEFSGLGEYIHLPVRAYSAGMKMRLMFSVACISDPDILLIDEMFSTGDIDFQTKATARLEKKIEQSNIFVFASHDIPLIKKYCRTVFKIDHGTITEIDINSLEDKKTPEMVVTD